MSESAKKALVPLIYAVLALSVLLVYWQVRDFGFVDYDDDDYVFENPHVLSGLTWDNVTWAFTTGHASNWHPVTWLSHMLDIQLFGPKPGWMHLVNVLLHLANTLLLFAVLKRMTGSLWPSAFVAAAFALHPMHVESVAWIAERKDVLSTFFLMLTLAAYVGYVKRPSVFRYLTALSLFALGLMTKPMLVTLPFVLLLLDYWPLGRIDTRRTLYRALVEKTPFFVLVAASSVITYFVQHSGGSVIRMDALPLVYRAANAFLSYARYIGKMFWPGDMAVFYPFDAHATELRLIAICALLIVVVSVLAIWFGRKQKRLFVGWFWFVGMLVPVIGLVQVGSQAIADRYTYLPYTGLFIMIAWGLPELLSGWPQRKLVMGVSAAVVLAAMGICSHAQAGYWKDSMTLFSHAIEVTQNNDIAYYNRGVAYAGLGRMQEAIDDFSQAVKIRPDYAEAYNNRGTAYDKLGRGAEAIEDYNLAIQAKPEQAESYYNRGAVYNKLGRPQEAIKDYLLAIKIKPDCIEAYTNLGVIYTRLGRLQDAVDSFNQAIRIKPDYAEAYNNLGVVYGGMDRLPDAVNAYQQATRIKPDYADAFHNLGNVYGRLGRYEDAQYAYKQAILNRPDLAVAYNNLALLLATKPGIKDRRTNEAIRLASWACELTNYKDPAFLGTLAATYASAGRFPEAVDTAEKAIKLADAAGQTQVVDVIRRHLSFYEQGKPFIEQ
jgi:tetratricopeptide (TPR) repeat protein